MDFLRDQASDSDEVVTPLMLDGTYLSRNFATLGPIFWQPPWGAQRLVVAKYRSVTSFHSSATSSSLWTVITWDSKRNLDDRQGRVADDETFVSDSWTSKYLPVAKYLSDVQGYVAHSHGRFSIRFIGRDRDSE